MQFERVYLFCVGVFNCIFLFAGVWWPFSSYRLMPFSSTVVTRFIVCYNDKRMHFECDWLFFVVFSIVVFLFAGVWWPFSNSRLLPFSSTVLTRVIMCKSEKRIHHECLWLFPICFLIVVFFLFAGVWWPFSSYRLIPFSSTVVTRFIVCKSDRRMHFWACLIILFPNCCFFLCRCVVALFQQQVVAIFFHSLDSRYNV